MGVSRGRRTVISSEVPIPTPLKHVPCHVEQPVVVRRKRAYGTGEWSHAVIERRMISQRRADVVREVCRAVIVGLVVRDGVRVAPRKSMPARPTPGRLLPLG